MVCKVFSFKTAEVCSCDYVVSVYKYHMNSWKGLFFIYKKQNGTGHIVCRDQVFLPFFFHCGFIIMACWH